MSSKLISLDVLNIFLNKLKAFHFNRTDNPHNVTAKQLGLDGISTTPDAQKEVLSATKIIGTNWTIEPSGNILYFKLNGTAIAKLDSNGLTTLSYTNKNSIMIYNDDDIMIDNVVLHYDNSDILAIYKNDEPLLIMNPNDMSITVNKVSETSEDFSTSTSINSYTLDSWDIDFGEDGNIRFIFDGDIVGLLTEENLRVKELNETEDQIKYEPTINKRVIGNWTLYADDDVLRFIYDDYCLFALDSDGSLTINNILEQNII